MNVIAKAAAMGSFAAAAALGLALPAYADPTDPDPIDPGDCQATASAECNVGPSGPTSPSNPNNPADPLNPPIVTF